MRKYQNALLAGVATLALVAGTGFASAQEQPKAQSTAPKTGQIHAAQPTKKAQPGVQAQGQSKGGLSAQNANKGMQQNANTGKQGQQNAKTNENKGRSVAQKGPAHNGKSKQAANRTKERNKQTTVRNERVNHRRQTTAQREREMRGRQSTAERQRTLKGLQGNASGQMQTSSGTNVRLSEQQRTHIRQTIIGARNAPRVGHVNFGVNVGTVIPRDQFTTIHVVPVPEYLVRIEPRWRGLEYFIFSDEVIIVNPRDLRIVAVVPA